MTFANESADSPSAVALESFTATDTLNTGNEAQAAAPQDNQYLTLPYFGSDGRRIEVWDTGAGFLPDAFPWSINDAFAQDNFDFLEPGSAAV